MATLASSAFWRTSLTYSRRRSSVSGGMGTRMTWPSLAGLSPWSLVLSAFSTAPIWLLS